MNIFERATRAKLRFSTKVGELATEHLFDLPLTSRTKENLDRLARQVHSELKDMDEVSFVDTRPDPLKTELELKLEILKHIIESKLKDREAAEKAAETAERKRLLTEALVNKQGEAVNQMSEEDIKKELAALGS